MAKRRNDAPRRTTVCSSVTYVLGLGELRRSVLRLSPLSVYLLWNSVNLGLAAAFVGALLLHAPALSFSVAQVPAADVATGYLIYLVGSLALHAGLQFSAPREGAAGWLDPGRRRPSILGLGALYALGLWVLWSPGTFARLGGPAVILRWAALAVLATAALAGPAKLRISRGAWLVLLLVGTALVLVANLMSYSKAYIMLSFLPLLWLLLTSSRYARWLGLFAPALVVLYFVGVAPVATAARQTPLTAGETPAARLLSESRRLLHGSTDVPEHHGLTEAARSFLLRQFDPAAVGYIQGEVARSGFARGEMMSYALTALVPRVVWPAKPRVTRGAWFAEYIGFAPSAEESTVSLGITATGELYWNFGVPGVLAGMVAIGVLFGLLWRMAGPDPRGQPLRMLLYCLVMLSMIDMPEAVSVLISILMALLFFAGVFATAALVRGRAAQRNAKLRTRGAE